MNKKYALISGGLILLVLFSVVLYSFIVINILEIQMYEPGEFGDSFGMLTALFSGLAFAGLIITLIMQGDELKAQREELKLTRETLKSQKDEMQAQNKTLAKHGFENTFFKLLEFLEVCIKDIRYSDLNFPSSLATGRDAMGSLYNTFYNEYLSNKPDKYKDLEFKKECKNKDGTSKAYNNFYNKNEGNLGQYYRVLYNILKLVKRELPVTKDALFYTNLVRAKLSKYELLLIFYNCLSPLGAKKMTPLVKEYKILKHLDKSLLPKEHLKLFKKFSE